MTSATTRSVDVVVVGAGLAGLTAADQLVQAGHDVVVVEGRDRVGGRVRTTEVAGVPVDAGATWVGPHHTEVRDLASRLGVQLVPQFHTGKGLLSFDGRRRVESATAMAPWVVLDVTRILNTLQKLADGLSVSTPWEHPDAEKLDSVSLGEWLTSKLVFKGTRKFVNMISLVHFGAPVGDVSLFNALRYIRTLGGLEVMLSVEGGDQQDRVLGTVHGLVTRYAEAVGAPILLDSPVERITTVGDRVTVRTAGETIEARYVVVAAAPAHRAQIEFSPALPDQHYGLSRSWRMGSLSKAFAAYDRPFWRGEGLSGEAVSDDGTVFLTYDVSPSPEGPGILMVFCDGRRFDGYEEPERRRRVVEQLVHLYGERARRLIDYTDFSWGNDSFAAGGPNPAVAPKAWTSFGRYLREPVGLVHWAGSETADTSSGTLNGAILSGQRAAREVAARLAAAVTSAG
ncbi:flavin monoamine oxidase family protein [Kineococcus sp. SYSU DK001]|uniref:flavin monoamine oxidase family protein n=1 Tax=Kineococcus sp. SYSU DK001 TaxID=3383122 RepID=UPI003D7D4869